MNHPWTTGKQMAYNTEAVLWGAFIDNRIDELAPNDGKVTVAGLVANNDFGKAYDSASRPTSTVARTRTVSSSSSETVEITAPTITDPMTTLASKNPQVFITMTAGSQCTQIIQEAARNGMKETAKYLFMSSVCKSDQLRRQGQGRR